MIRLLLAATLLACGAKPVPEGTPPAVEVNQDELAAAKRPQTPKPPLPYPTRELVFAAADGVTLAGTLSLPEGPGPHPALVLLTGSGAQDRDETMAGHKPFAVWADHLARNGVATLRLDDRGVGGSGGSLSASTLRMLAADAGSALDQLAVQPELDANRLGLLGHSEGGTVAALTASQRPELAALVLLAAPGVDGVELLVAQASAILEVAGVPSAAVGAHAAAHRDALATLDEPERQREAFRAFAALQVDLAVTHLGAAPLADVEPFVDQAISQVNTAIFRSMIQQDPSATVALVKAPILAVGGGLDLQVLPRQNLDTLSRALQGHPDAKMLEFPGLNHLFQHAGRGTPEEYALIQETVAPEVLAAVQAWLTERLLP